MFTLDFHDAEVFQLIRQIQERGGSMRPAMRIISGIMFEEVQGNFQAEGRPVKWPALAPATIAQREKLGKWPGKMLQRSQAGLFPSMTQRVTEDQAIVGSNKKYAALQFLGGKAGRGRKVYVPARNPLTLRPKTVGEIKFALMQWLFKRQQ